MTRAMGLDPGDVRIGIALSDPTGTIASPHGSLDARSGDVVTSVRELAVEYDVEVIVVGLPLRLDGTEGPAARRSRELGTALDEGLDLPIEFADERFTTVTAEQALLEGNVRRAKRTVVRDAVAAAVMLQGWLDRRRRLATEDDDGHEHDLEG